MKQGDFTLLAKEYHNRTGYSAEVLRALGLYVSASTDSSFQVAEVGAGTGKLTRQLLERNWHVVAVEPNDAMRAEGKSYTRDFSVEWRAGTGEETGLAAESYNWAMMASSFHWTDPKRSLPEFYRILKPGGYLTVLWNPRDLEQSELHARIEKRIHDLVPGIQRVSSGSKKYTEGIEKTLLTTGHFKNVIFMEAQHIELMSKERYMGAWRSVNDIQAQAGEARWQEILKAIEEEIADMDEIVVPYKTRAWTCQKVD